MSDKNDGNDGNAEIMICHGCNTLEFRIVDFVVLLKEFERREGKSTVTLQDVAGFFINTKNALAWQQENKKRQDNSKKN